LTLVEADVDGRIATITLQAPPANALGLDVARALAAAVARVGEEEAVRVVVVRSGVEKFFAAGADIELMAGADESVFSNYIDELRGAVETIPSLPVVSIAAVDGHALGGGLELALACDLRVVSPRAKLGLPEVRLGLLPGAGGTQRLPRLVGHGRALELMLSGRAVGGEEAVGIGLAERLAEGGDAAAEALRLARRLAAFSRPALAAIKRSAAAAWGPLDEGMEVERRAIVGLHGGPDAREGLAAFLEKRTPDFE
jgi:enoyl-CoA hydratase/carnithine racemase